mgnify:CR=1 FL=1
MLVLHTSQCYSNVLTSKVPYKNVPEMGFEACDHWGERLYANHVGKSHRCTVRIPVFLELKQCHQQYRLMQAAKLRWVEITFVNLFQIQRRIEYLPPTPGGWILYPQKLRGSVFWPLNKLLAGWVYFSYFDGPTNEFRGFMALLFTWKNTYRYRGLQDELEQYCFMFPVLMPPDQILAILGGVLGCLCFCFSKFLIQNSKFNSFLYMILVFSFFSVLGLLFSVLVS